MLGAFPLITRPITGLTIPAQSRFNYNIAICAGSDPETFRVRLLLIGVPSRRLVLISEEEDEDLLQKMDDHIV